MYEALVLPLDPVGVREAARVGLYRHLNRVGKPQRSYYADKPRDLAVDVRAAVAEWAVARHMMMPWNHLEQPHLPDVGEDVQVRNHLTLNRADVTVRWHEAESDHRMVWTHVWPTFDFITLLGWLPARWAWENGHPPPWHDPDSKSRVIGLDLLMPPPRGAVAA